MTAVLEVALAPEVRELAGKAAALLRDHGWCQGVFSDADGRLCVLGAVCKSTPDVDATISVLHAIRARTGGTVITWNDDPARTEAEVLDLLDSIANG